MRLMSIPLDQIEKLLAPVLEQEAAELVDLQYIQESGRPILRCFVDKAGGIKLSDCERLSERIGSVLDVQDIPSFHYTLEISSPGVDRILKKERDFIRFQGHPVKLRLKLPWKERRNFRGTLKSFESGKITIECGTESFQFDLASIAEARLDPEIKP